jgi:peptidoglycan/LPS O-acetylase OafA/YrhL
MTHSRVASLDFLRGVAALSVAIPHFFMYRHSGGVVAETVSILGVEIFFVLSGYVLAPQIIAFTIEQPRAGNLGIFLIRRWMRTVPPYLIALLIMSITAHKLFTADFFRYLVYVQNLFGQHNSDDYFSIAWSLSVEEWFYLSFPLLCIAAVSVFPRRLSAAVFACLLYIAAISAARILWGDTSHWGSGVRRVVVFRMDAIAWGFLLNIAVRRIAPLERFSVIGAFNLFVVMAGIAFTLTFVDAEQPSRLIEASFPIFAPGFGAGCILLALKLEGAFEKRRWLAEAGLFLGRISYSTYLFHLLVLAAVAPWLGGLPTLAFLLVYLAVVAVVASLMYTAVEAPILASRPRFRKSIALGCSAEVTP